MQRDVDEITPHLGHAQAGIATSPSDKKEYDSYPLENEKEIYVSEVDPAAEAAHAKNDLDVTGDDLLKAEARLSTMSMDRTRVILEQLYKMHEHDQNFPQTILERIQEFLSNPDVWDNPMKHHELIHEMKLEALLVTENSPYAEVRAVVENTDDPDMPSFTFRTWFIGIIFCAIGALINQLFSLRQPPITITSEVAQLLAFPAGKFCDKVFPDWGFTFRGKRHSINPGKFNKKEHMLITIMATVAFNTPYTSDIIVSQVLPQYFNQSYARNFLYQLLTTVSTNFCGYGLAGLVRRFLVYPSYCVWPASLVTIALNRAFHSGGDEKPVPGPFGKLYTWSRMKFFFWTFAAMFVWFWFPGYLFTALSSFSWISWIAPNNGTLNNIVGFNNGLGINPWPTFDFNVISGWIQSSYNPLVVPGFTTFNLWVGMVIGLFFSAAFYWTNTWNTGYLPINDNHIFDNTGSRFNVSRVIDDRGILDVAKYQTYSQPYLSAGNLAVYFWFFANYTATISYTILFHRKEIAMGFKGMWKSVRSKGRVQEANEDDLSEDIHSRMMRQYKEVPEWWYLSILALALITGMVGIGVYQTYTTPAVVLFGIAMALVFIIPVGLIAAITGMQVTMNVLAELIGANISPGNALSMNYFKAFGYITTAQAIYFSNDLKLAHYLKIPPRNTFVAQVVATLVSTFVCTGILNFQINGIPNVCTSEASFGMTCPGINTFFTAAVFWGTIGPKRNFGADGPYKALLIGFPVGLVIPVFIYYLKKRFPYSRVIRQIHPVIITFGALSGAPYNISYMTPAVYVAALSWIYVKKRYLAFWSKYNFVLGASFTSGIAIAGIVIFFCLNMTGTQQPEWWGNTVSSQGCEGEACVRLALPDKRYFGPEPGSFP